MVASPCLERARAYAAIDREPILFDGVFYRDLPQKEVAKRYESETAEFGYRIKCGRWTNSSDGVSVNHSECCTPSCSVLIGGRNTPHVAQIHLKELGDITGLDLYAKYDPQNEPQENPCHYLLLPRSKSPEDLVAALIHLDGEIPKKRPITLEERTHFEQIRSRHETALRLIRDVNGQPDAH
jgi:hypothetical protein